MNAQVIQVIRTELTLAGKGTEESPYRRLTQYWSLTGRLLFEADPCPDDPAPPPREEESSK